MDVQVWSKSQEKRGHVLALRGDEVALLTLSGNAFTLKKKLKDAIEKIAAGVDPAQVGTGSVKRLAVASISKAEVSPGNSSLTLRGEGENAPSLSFPTADDNAEEILKTILGRAGRTFQQSQENIGVFEALIGPGILGVIGGLLWMGTYDAARTLASGEAVEVSGRRRGMKQLLVGVADTLGTTGTIVVGVLLLLLVLGWAFRRVTVRPQRAVWVPASS